MTHSSIAVANEFLKLSVRDSIPVTPMKLQKLVYYAQGWHLGVMDSPLVSEPVECWAYGPVFRKLYGVTKSFGGDSVHGPLTNKDRSTADMDCKEGDESLKLVQRVWDSYKQYSAERLSNMTHSEDSPWKRVRNVYKAYEPPAGTDIPVEYIKEHFTKLSSQGQQ